MPEWRCSVLYQTKNVWQWARACSMESNRIGKSGRYFVVLNCDSEYARRLQAEVVNYADDFVILCREGMGDEAMLTMRRLMRVAHSLRVCAGQVRCWPSVGTDVLDKAYE